MFLTQFLFQASTKSTSRMTKSTGAEVGRPDRSTDVHRLVHAARTVGGRPGRSTGAEKSALCIWAVGRAVDRVAPTVTFLTVGGRPAGRPLACQAARSA